MPEDTVFISSKPNVHPHRYDRDIDPTAKCRQTDGRMAFQLYIVDNGVKKLAKLQSQS